MSFAVALRQRLLVRPGGPSHLFVCTYDDLYSRWDGVMVGQDLASLGPGGVLIITPSVTMLAQDERVHNVRKEKDLLTPHSALFSFSIWKRTW